MSEQYILALDQGTTSARTIAYDLSGNEITQASCPYQLSYPQAGWVEQDPHELIRSQFTTLEIVLKKISPKNVIGIGVTNQRETVICWDKKTGQALAPAIVWQCRRTATLCEQIKNSSMADTIRQKTGLTVDAYFSATKINWLLKNNKVIREKYDAEEVIFGTVDSWLIYNLTKNTQAQNFLTDSSNASRTMLYNLSTNEWDEDLLDYFEIKRHALCKIKPSNSEFGEVSLFGLKAKIHGVLGDQQSSLLGHFATETGNLKCTFGTGAFLLKNTGSNVQYSNSGLLSTVAWSLKNDDDEIKLTYALEGSIFIAGALMQWLRDKLGLISSTAEIEPIASAAGGSNDIVIVPAFVGLGSPHWDSSARGSIFGLTGDSNKAQILYAALEAVAHQVCDLLELPELTDVNEICVDGGMTNNDLFNQILADLTGKKILVAKHLETTALGAFCIAAYGLGLLDPFKQKVSTRITLVPKQKTEMTITARRKWKKALEKASGWLE